MYVYVYPYPCPSYIPGQKTMLDPQEPELEVVVSHWMRVLGTEHWFTGGVAHALTTDPSLGPRVLLILYVFVF